MEMPHNMDILDGAIFWYTPRSKSTKGNYYIFIFRALVVCVVSMALWMKNGHHYLLFHFYKIIDIISWWCEENFLIYPTNKYKAKGSSNWAHSTISKLLS